MKRRIWQWVWGPIFGIVLAGILAPPAWAQESTLDRIRKGGVLKVGAAISEPHFGKDPKTGEWYGIGIDVAKDVAKELGVRLEVVETSWATAVAGLQTGKFDVMFSLDPTPQRALAIDFTAPFYNLDMALLVAPELKGKVRTWDDMNKPNMRVGSVLGTSSDQIAVRFLPKANITHFKAWDDAYLAFQSKRLDAVAQLAFGVMNYRKKINYGEMVLPKPVAYIPTAGGVRREADKSWRDWLSVVMTYLQTTGRSREIVLHYVAQYGLTELPE